MTTCFPDIQPRWHLPASEHVQRLAAVLDLDSGLAAILTPDRDADGDELSGC